MTKMLENEIEGLKKLVLQSGFPLEIEVSSFLAKQCNLISEDFEVTMSDYYLDKDLNKGRELDIKVDIPIESPKTSSTIFLDLLIQCKNLPGNAWVFSKAPQRVVPACRSTSILDLLDWRPRWHVVFSGQKDLHYKQIELTKAYHEFVLDKKGSNKKDDNLFETVISLAKATSYELGMALREFREELEDLSEEELKKYQPDQVKIFYPLAIFNGKMYLAEEVEKGMDMKLTPIDHIGLLFNYVSGSYDIELVIDILHKKALERFFKSIVSDANVLREALGDKRGAQYREEVTKALRWYMSKEKSSDSSVEL